MADIIAISGCSSSGKTTLVRLLKNIFPNIFILHEDDFYLADDKIPTRNGVHDWDCVEALDIAAMKTTLKYIREHGRFPSTLESKEDQNTTGPVPIADAVLSSVRSHVASWLETPRAKTALSSPLCLFDGFLLFTPAFSSIQSLLSLKLFLLISRQQAIDRRAARLGYVTLDGFWKDPPGYVEDIVWPNYEAEHRWLFREGKVSGRMEDVDEQVVTREGIKVKGEGSLSGTLQWAVEEVILFLETRQGTTSQIPTEI